MCFIGNLLLKINKYVSYATYLQRTNRKGDYWNIEEIIFKFICVSVYYICFSLNLMLYYMLSFFLYLRYMYIILNYYFPFKHLKCLNYTKYNIIRHSFFFRYFIFYIWCVYMLFSIRLFSTGKNRKNFNACQNKNNVRCFVRPNHLFLPTYIHYLRCKI